MREDNHNTGPMYALVTPDGRVYVNPSPPALPRALADGVSIVEITRSGEPPEREMIVNYNAAPGNHDVVKAALTEWAGATRHVRLWLPEEIIDLSDVLPPIGGEVTCNACGAKHRATGMDFMQTVIAHGSFPTICPCCSGRLPQWHPLDGPTEEPQPTLCTA